MEEAKPIHSLVLDAGPLLLNQPSISTLLAKSEQIFTTPTVLAEIRDETARNRVENTVKPFLTVRTPSPPSVKAVSEFARKTGDLAVLSRADLQIFALAYELECERNHGDWRLRSSPGQKLINGSPPQPSEERPAAKDQTVEQAASSVVGDASMRLDGEGTGDSRTASDLPCDSSTILHAVSALALEPAAGAEQDITDDDKLRASRSVDGNLEVSAPSSGSDSDGWITPSNLKRHQQRDNKSTESDEAPQKTLQVATLTTDFALQNSLLLMNLNLLSSSLMRVSHLSSHILRCHACFATTKEMSRQFCPRCGGPTLTRVSCSTTSKGGFKLHLKRNMQWNTRGDRYSIPKPVGGTSSGKTGKGGRGQGGKGGWGKELLLAEDQKEYVRALGSEKRRKEKNLMDEDYLPGILTGERASGGKVRIGAGRNINSRKR